MSLEHLLKAASTFEKIATFDFKAICDSYKGAIQQELHAGINALNKLVTTNERAANSYGIESLDAAFGKIGDAVRQLTPEVADITLADMKAAIGNASFYTSSQNAGTGYDAVTREGGAWSPAAYLQRITNYVNKLDKYNTYYKSLNKPNSQQSMVGKPAV